jgi:hypothetical protein
LASLTQNATPVPSDTDAETVALFLNGIDAIGYVDAASVD